MRRKTSPAAAPTPTSPAPSQTMGACRSGSGRVEDTARVGPAGAAAACGARVGWEFRALMDNAVGRAEADGAAVAAPQGAAAAAPVVSGRPSWPVAGPPAPAGPASTSVTAAGAPAPLPGPVALPAPAAGAAPGGGAAAGPGWEANPDAAPVPAFVPEPGAAGAGDEGLPAAADAVDGTPGAKGVTGTVGSVRSGRGCALADASAVAPAVAVGEPVDRVAFTAGTRAPGTARMDGALGPGVRPAGAGAPPAASWARASAAGSWGGGAESSARDAGTPVDRTSTAPTAAAAAPRRIPPWIPVRDMESSDLC